MVQCFHPRHLPCRKLRLNVGLQGQSVQYAKTGECKLPLLELLSSIESMLYITGCPFPKPQHALVAFTHTLVVRVRSRLTRRQSIIEARELALEAGQLKLSD